MSGSEICHESSGQLSLKSLYAFCAGWFVGGEGAAAPQLVGPGQLFGQQVSQLYWGLAPPTRKPGGGPYFDTPTASQFEPLANQEWKNRVTDVCAPLPPILDKYTSCSGLTPWI